MKTSTPHHSPRITSVTRNLDAVLDVISAGAAARDAEPAFPEGPFRGLAASGVLGMTAPRPQTARERPVSFEREWRTLRAVARADGSVGRILDGHFNAVERLSVLAPEPLRSSELEAVADGGLRLGVWGADPLPGEGEPARLTSGGGHVSGVKTFCSGSTGLDRAVVLVRGEDGVPGPPLVAYVDLSEGAEVDTTWFRGHGMRSSESHRVVFGGARVLAVLGGPGELLREPYFSRDAFPTAVT
jgi:alkylation response protein AidB-like acyl-CoA dehydrogenase